MLPIDNLSVVRPSNAAPGTLLICGAQRLRAPLLMLDATEVRYGVEFSERGPVMNRIEPGAAYYLDAGKPTLLVDYRARINLHEADFRPGLAFVTSSARGLIVDLQQRTLRYVTMAGEVIDEPSHIDALALFPKWRIVVPGLGKEVITIAQSGSYNLDAVS
jgi:hypothetical protein